MGVRIMLIEDDADSRQAMLVRLRAHQYEVIWAQDTISAVAMAIRERPDLILLDIGLPGGDGILVIERLRMLDCFVPIVVLSARDPALNRERALHAGAATFLEKPVDNDILLAAIEEHLRQPDEGVRMSIRIMLVEDNADIRQAMLVRLRGHRYEVIWAQDAISAVSMAIRERPDLILLDIGLPGGDGFLVIERLRSLDCFVPIIVLSARDPSLNRERALHAGAATFLEKPVDNDILLAAIEEHLAVH